MNQTSFSNLIGGYHVYCYPEVGGSIFLENIGVRLHDVMNYFKIFSAAEEENFYNLFLRV